MPMEEIPDQVLGRWLLKPGMAPTVNADHFSATAAVAGAKRGGAGVFVGLVDEGGGAAVSPCEGLEC